MIPPMPCSRTPNAMARPSGCSVALPLCAVELGAGVAREVGTPETRAGTSSAMALRHDLIAAAGGHRLSPASTSAACRANPVEAIGPAGVPFLSVARPASRRLSQRRGRPARGHGLAIEGGPRRAPRTTRRGQPEDLLGRPDLVRPSGDPWALGESVNLGRRPADVAAQHQEATACPPRPWPGARPPPGRRCRWRPRPGSRRASRRLRNAWRRRR
jgi:hypothetical protein